MRTSKRILGRGMIQRLWKWLLHPPVTGPGATMVIRLMAGGVFFWEGILKFVYVNQGVGRFTKLGIPFPLVAAPFVGWLEIIGGPTKPRLFLGTLPLPPPPAPPQVGIWAVLHEIRSEYAQIMSCIFLLVSGPGPGSVDAALLSSDEDSGEEFVGAPAWPAPRRALGR